MSESSTRGYDAVVWDLDGVLVDSRDEAWRVGSELLALLGNAVTIESQEVFRHHLHGDGTVPADDTVVLRDMHRLVMQQRAHRVRLFPCIQLVDQLGVGTDIVTSSSLDFVHRVLGDHLRGFRAIRAHEDGPKTELLRSVSFRALYVTDTVVDVGRCHDSGRDVVAVGWGYDSIEAIRNSHPTFLAESQLQLERLFARLGLLIK